VSAAAAADVAIVGAGITGLSIAWHMAERGASVIVLDGRGIGSGATAIQPGGVRQQWGTRVACVMAREAYVFYRELRDRLEPQIDPGFSACGYLFVAHTDPALAQLSSHVALQNELGIPSRVLSPDEAGELVDGLDPSGLSGAVWCDQDGYFDRPQAVVGGFVDAARRCGVAFVDRDVEALRTNGAGWSLTLAGGETASAEHVVVAAAYDSPALLRPLGIDLPIEREPRYLFYSNPIRERLLEPLVVSPERHFAAKHLADGSVLASDLRAGGDPAGEKADWYAHVRRTIAELLPILEHVSFPVMVEGFYDVTPDHNPIFGALEQRDGLWIAAGLNGRGLMMAPTVGRVLADAVLSGELDATIAALAPSRFDSGDLVHERQVV
jgi:sarcosine oxidase subunit beta